MLRHIEIGDIVHLKIEGPDLRVVATDCDRIAVVWTNLDGSWKRELTQRFVCVKYKTLKFTEVWKEWNWATPSGYSPTFSREQSFPQMLYRPNVY